MAAADGEPEFDSADTDKQEGDLADWSAAENKKKKAREAKLAEIEAKDKSDWDAKASVCAEFAEAEREVAEASARYDAAKATRLAEAQATIAAAEAETMVAATIASAKTAAQAQQRNVAGAPITYAGAPLFQPIGGNGQAVLLGQPNVPSASGPGASPSPGTLMVFPQYQALMWLGELVLVG